MDPNKSAVPQPSQPVNGVGNTVPPVVGTNVGQTPVNPAISEVKSPLNDLPAASTLGKTAVPTATPVANFTPTTMPPPPTTGGNFTGAVPSAPAGKKSAKTSLYLAVIIIFVATVIALGWLIYNYSLPQTTQAPQPTPVASVSIPAPSVSPSPAEGDDLEAISEQGTSDEIVDIEKDLKTTDVTKADSELESIKNELSQ